MKDEFGREQNNSQAIRSLDKVRMAMFLQDIKGNPDKYPNDRSGWVEWLNKNSGDPTSIYGEREDQEETEKKMEIYFEKTNGNNIVIVTDGQTAKVFNGAPDALFADVDLNADDAADLLRRRLQELDAAGELNGYNDMYSPNEMEYEEIREELEESAELVFIKQRDK